MRKLLLLAFLLQNCFVFGQSSVPNLNDITKPVDILPPAPNSASLGQFGDINFGLASGTISYSVPIYSLSSTSLNLPISLSYSSNGLKVDAVASRVGTGWNLEVGGIITRTVMGAPDESYSRISPPGTYPQPTLDLINFMESLSQSGETGPVDGQPDIFAFSFNGYSGRFILDSNLNPVLLSPSAIKIETNFTSSVWNFKITTPDGIQYFFGGTNATENSKKFSSGSNCGKSYSAYLPTAWYLNSIVHPNNDQITFTYTLFGFNYKAAISESQFYKLTTTNTCPTAGDGYGNCTTMQNTSCFSWYTTNTPLLQEINTSGGSKVTFGYINRNDVADKLLNKIEVFQPNNSQSFKIFNLNYQEVTATQGLNAYSNSDNTLKVRPFLTDFVEKSTDSITKTYKFYYNDLQNLPARLSYSQDHYGYYNGANTNSTLLPTPSTDQWKRYFPSANANRESNDVYAQKGLLNKITYPTGGSDQIFYEGNTVKTNVRIDPPTTSVNAQSYSENLNSSLETITYSQTVVISYDQETQLNGSCVFEGTAAEADPIHNKARIIIENITSGTTVVDRLITPGQVVDEILTLAPASYRVKVIAMGYKVRAAGSLTYRSGMYTYQTVNKIIGGVRVSKIVTSNETDGKTSIKKYNYLAFSDPNFSSGGLIYQPNYEKTIHNKVMCDGTNATPPGGTQVYWCTFNDCNYASIYSNTLNNIYLYNGASVYYSSVIESFGENYENGGIEHQFTVAPDMPANLVVGEDVMSAPYTSFSYKNGLETFQHVFKKINGSNISVKKVFTNYKEDPRIDQTFKAYVANKKYNVWCQHNPPSDDEVNAYNLIEYNIYRKWYYPEEVKTWTYDKDGQSYVEQIDTTIYDNPLHALPTQIRTVNSGAIETIVRNYYPQDLSLTGAEEQARLNLISKNIVSPILKQTVTKNNALQLTLQTNYNVFTNGLVLPYKKYSAIKNNALEERFAFSKYNNKGQLLEQNKTSDVTSCYIWGYNSLYPIAEVVNSSALECGYTSFEEEGKGNWNYSGTAQTDNAAATGKNVYSLGSGNITISTLSSTATYVVSYWSRNGAQNVNGVSGVQGASHNSWTYFEHKVVNPLNGTVTISGTGTIDELRIFPLRAMMKTFTYEPLIGATSQADANSRITYYEYDGLGRLLLMRDQDKNILKKFCYTYTGQVQGCLLFRNAQKSQSFTRNNCGSGYAGGSVVYTVLAYKYVSTISQVDADAQAQEDINANGQNYANQNGTCSLIYYNVQKSGTFTKNNCSAGATGSNVTYIVAAGTYSSTVSQAAADQLAQNDVNNNGQTYANNNGICTWWNVAISGTFTRNNCSTGGTGSPVTYTVAAGTYSSTTSQAAADALAQNDVNTNGQNYANSYGTCTWWNVVKSGSFTRNNCASGYIGSTVTYTVAAGTYSSTTSQAAADQLAQNDVNTNGQNYANANGTCTQLTIYAKIVLTDQFNDAQSSTATVLIKFFSDNACTVPVSVSNLTVNYKCVRTNCSGTSPLTTNYSATCSGTQYSLGTETTHYDDGIHCWNYVYSVIAGTGYVAK